MVNQAKDYEQQIRKWLSEIKGKTAKKKMIALLDRVVEGEIDGADALLVRQVLKSPQVILSSMQENFKVLAPVYAQLFKEGAEDGSMKINHPDECAQVFTLLLDFWCSNVIFECDANTLRKRALFFQQVMKALGADIISDKLISHLSKYLVFK